MIVSPSRLRINGGTERYAGSNCSTDSSDWSDPDTSYSGILIDECDELMQNSKVGGDYHPPIILNARPSQSPNTPLDNDLKKRDAYTWIWNLDTGYGDLLIVSIDRQGSLLRPTIVFDRLGKWGKGCSNYEEAERNGCDKGGLFERLRSSQEHKGKDSSWSHYLTDVDTCLQFCAIIPCDIATSEMEGTAFRELRSALRLDELLIAAGQRIKWCKTKCKHRNWNCLRCLNACCSMT